MSAIYRYSINGHSVIPRLGNDMLKDYELESGQRFFRAKLSGKVAFVGDDFDYLLSQPFDTDFIFLIERYFDGVWTDYLKSKFNKTDGKWDEDDRIVDVTMSVYDTYNPVVEGLDKEYNLIELAPEIESLIINKRPLIQLYIPGESVLSCFVGGTYWEQDCSEMDVEADILALHFVKASQLIALELTGQATPADIVSAYAGKTSGQYLGNSPDYRMTYSEIPEYDEYENPTGLIIYKYAILRISDEQAMFESEGYGAPLRNEVRMLPVEGSGATGELFVYGRLIDVWMRYLLDVPTLNDVPTFPIPIDDITDNNRNYKYCTTYNFDLAAITARYSTTPTKWGKNDYGGYFREPYSISGQKFYPIARSNWGNASIWFTYDLMDSILEAKARKAYRLKDAYSIEAVIKALLAVIAPTITHEGTEEYSSFLYSAINPVSLQVFKLFMTQKTNVTSGDYDKPAQKAPVTLGEVLGMLRDVFRCFWFIEDNKFKIEHVLWFNNGGAYSGTQAIGADLTTLVYRKNGKKWGFNSSSYDYDKSALPERLEYNWMDSVSEAFTGFPIEIENKYVSKGNVESVQLSKFTSDIDYLLFNPSSVSQDGFALMAAIKDNLYDPLAVNAMGYVFIGRYLTINSAYNTTDYMPTIPGETYVGEKLVILNWYDEDKVYITSINSPVDNQRYIAPTNAAFARVSVSTANWNLFMFRNASYSLPFVELTLDGADLRLQNGYLSWIILHPSFHLWDLPAKNAKVNGESIVAFGAKKSKKQVVEYPSSDDPNLFHLIKTYLGNGQIEKISINLASQMNKITLKYDTE